ncbi:NEW3 domain-containing protein [Paenibacillus sp. GCM10027626]|uniref:COG1470 family protein n=1 Tax=Paenibacillus sp. GCM10027626 TaxID=3273411 RepID=UPI0036286821
MRQACRNGGITLLLFSIILMVSGGLLPQQSYAAAAVELFTPYTDLSAPPGDSINYSIDLINRTDSTQNLQISLDTGGHDWKYELTAGGRAIRSLAVKPGAEQSINLQIDIPLKVNKGSYTFTVIAKGAASLPLTINVNEQGTFASELTTDQPNIEGHADSTFTFSTTLRNRTGEQQTYALAAAAPAGWDVRFKSGSNNVTSVTVEPNATQSIEIEAVPAENAKADTYKIPIRAANNSTSAEATVEAVITGSYGVKLTTADERLSTDVTAGSTRTLDLVVANTGTAELQDVNLSSQTPADWEVTFEPSSVRSIAPGKSAQVKATIKASKEALPGDYALNLSASTSQKSSSAAIRVAVESSVLWGWIGVLIIVVVIGIIAFLFRKYGRR